MSSNPFRRPVGTAGSDRGPGTELDNEDRLPSEAASGTKNLKVVRISSGSPPRPRPEGASSTNAQTLPAAFQDLLPYVTNAYLSVKRPSWPAVSGAGDEAESSDDDDDGPEEAGAGEMAAATAMASSRGPSRLPHNLVGARLLNTEGANAAGASAKQGVPSSQRAALDAIDARREGAGKSTTATAIATVSATALDVDAFKNLLMTGDRSRTDLDNPVRTDLSNSGLRAQHPARTAGMLPGENSSSTDTSSISRHSTEPTSQYTPRSSSERSRSDHEEADAGPTPRRSDSQKVKPPPPRHRHGKSISLPEGPQIVSFADFSTPEASSPISPVTSPGEHSRRVSDDYRKPLPPTPQTRVSRNASGTPSELSRTVSSGSVRSEQVSGQKKQAPPPPLARRASVRNVLSPPSRTPSGTMIRPDQESIPEGSTSLPKIAPPPPAPRRGGNSHSQSQSLDDSTSPSLTRSPSVKFAPPVPEARRARASSRASASSIPAASSDSKSSSSTSTPMASPPPPPPRRMSSRSCIDEQQRRANGGSQRSSFETLEESGSERQGVAAHYESQAALTSGTADVKQPRASKDILADMDALQREIDALMARDGKGAA